MKRDVATPKAYLADLNSDEREIVERIRKVIRRVMPGVEEGLRYGMLDYPGLANLAAQKNYVALYVAPEVLRRHRSNFPGVDAGKSCLRFRRLDQADPAALASLLKDVRAAREAAGSEDHDRPD